MQILTQKPDYEVIVVGARAAGAATAFRLAKGGARVLMVERDTHVGDTLSTHALMRPAVQLLANWGLLESSTQGTEPVTVTTFTYGDESIAVPIKPTPEMAGLYAPRRFQLDNTLVEAAEVEGADLALGRICTELLRDADNRVRGVQLQGRDGSRIEVTADLVVGADGRRSSVANMAGAATRRHSTAAAATVYTYVEGLKNEGYRWFYAEGEVAGLIPSGDGLHCLFVSCRPKEFRKRLGAGQFKDALDILATWEPDLADALQAQGPAERMRRYLGAPAHIKAAHGPGWALVGDAGYFKDPASAHGISDAFLDADRLARAYLTGGGDLAAYEATRDRHAEKLFAATQEMAAMQWEIPRLQELHQILSLCMKEECLEISTPVEPMARAA